MISLRAISAAAAIGVAIFLAAACGGSSVSNETTTAAATQADTSAAAETGAAAAQGTLDGTVGPGFTITLTQNGQQVTTLAEAQGYMVQPVEAEGGVIRLQLVQY